jgi:hypothetical protein
MPPKLNPNKTDRIDGDNTRIKDYDVKDGQDKKKYTYFYTKQELELQKAREKANAIVSNNNNHNNTTLNELIN